MKRLGYIDALRGLAIIFMIINHVGHYALGGVFDYNIYLAIYLTVSIAGPLFLFLVGFSLVLSYKKEGFIKYFKRGLELIILNFLINGFFYFNEPLYRGRILFLIGISIIISYPFLLFIKQKVINKWLVLIAVIFGFFFYSFIFSFYSLVRNNFIKEVFFSEFTFFPWFLLILLGVIFAEYWLNLDDKIKLIKLNKIGIFGLFLVGVWFFVSIIMGRMWFFSFDYDLNINNYWVPSFLTWFWIIGLIFLIFGVVYKIYQDNKFLIIKKFLSNLENIGRYSIYMYFFQFFIIRTLLEKNIKPQFIYVSPIFYLLIISLLIIIFLCFLVKFKMFAKIMELSRLKVSVKIF